MNKMLLAPIYKIVRNAPKLTPDNNHSIKTWLETMNILILKLSKSLSKDELRSRILFVRKNAVLINQICLVYLSVARKNGVIDKIIDTEELKEEVRALESLSNFH